MQQKIKFINLILIKNKNYSWYSIEALSSCDMSGESRGEIMLWLLNPKYLASAPSIKSSFSKLYKKIKFKHNYTRLQHKSAYCMALDFKILWTNW